MEKSCPKKSYLRLFKTLAEDLQNLLEPTPKKDTLFIKANWNAKVGSQEIPGEMGKFGLGVQNETGKG